MILFKCVKCGAVIDAQDEYVGCQAACNYCGAEQPVPAASDPSCVLIFTESSPATGTPMTAAELHIRVGEGTVRANDLIWADGMWQPLSAVFEMPANALPEVTPPDGTAEIATSFSQLPPLGGMKKLQRHRHSGTPALSMDGEAAPDSPARRRVKLALAIAVMVVGLFCALKVFNSVTGRDALVVLRNDGAEAITVATPGHNPPQRQLQPGQTTNLGGLAVVMSGSHKIAYTREASEGAVAEHIAVPVAPGCVTVASVGTVKFPLLKADFDPEHLSKHCQGRSGKLAQELATADAPAALLQLFKDLDRELEQSLDEYSSLRCYPERKYRLDLYLAGTGGGIKLRLPIRSNDRRPILLPPAGGTIANPGAPGDSFVLGENLKLTELTTTATNLSLPVGGGFTATGDAVFTLKRSERNELSATLTMKQTAVCNQGGRKPTGRWRCTASGTAGAWQARWELVAANNAVLLVVPAGQAPRLP